MYKIMYKIIPFCFILLYSLVFASETLKITSIKSKCFQKCQNMSKCSAFLCYFIETFMIYSNRLRENGFSSFAIF